LTLSIAFAIPPGMYLRSIQHRNRDGSVIRLCWLALLLIRVAELTSGDTWRRLRDELDRMHLGSFRVSDQAKPVLADR
jgi:hypothetical protein